MGGTTHIEPSRNRIGPSLRGISVGHLPTLLLVGGCLNGLAARMLDATSQGGGFPFFGISPIELFAAMAGASVMWNSATQEKTGFGVAEGLMLAAMLLPSSTFAWIATAAYALHRARLATLDERAGPLLFFALSVCAIWAATALKWLTIPITTLEAQLVAGILGVVRNDIMQTANIVGQLDGHLLVILTACSTADGLPRVLLGIAAVVTFLAHDKPRLGAALIAAACAYAFGNTLRLVLMAWSAEVYDVVHGDVGANVFDGLQIALVLAAGTWACRS